MIELIQCILGWIMMVCSGRVLLPNKHDGHRYMLEDLKVSFPAPHVGKSHHGHFTKMETAMDLRIGSSSTGGI